MGVLTTTVTLLLLYAAILTSSQKLKNFTAQYGGPFNDTVYYRTIFEVEYPATISNDALQVTPDTFGDSSIFSLNNRSGRILLRRPFKLFNPKSSNTTRISSFTSSFLINIYRPNNETAGEGLAFVIAPNLDLPANSSGEYLGLSNPSTDGNPSNKFVAVEFDTYKQEFDPDDNHIGLDVNSVRSIETESLLAHGIQLAPLGAKLYNVWIIYDGVNKTLEVYMVEQTNKGDPTPAKPTTPLLKSNLDLRDFVDENSYFGFSASTGNEIQLNCVLRWNLTVEYFASKEGPSLKIVLGAAVPVVVLVVMGVAALACFLHRRKTRAGLGSNILGALKSLPGMPREFQYKELKKATNNFDEKYKLGQGGYGVVYRGIMHSENLDLAVKCFSRENIKGEDDFLAELTIINRLRHKHLVRLLGWCNKNGKLLLVYEYMPNGSLDKHLFHGANTETLSWILRYKIISGVASALHYLHNEYDQKVVHRDLKASNIMLDSNFNARLGDFGLARALDNEKTSYAEAEGVLGTIGYIAPECFHTGKATQHSDVYAFGAVLLEVVCGQRPGARIGGFHVLVDWVWSLYREGQILRAVDERLGEDFVEEEAKRILMLGLACSHPIANKRPKTQAIVQIIEGLVEVPEVPHFKPSFVWPAMGPMGDISDAFTADTTSITTSQFGSEYSPQFLSREGYMGYSDQHSLV
ncbi:hypothetical protein LguiB_018877 [Lonicera macranthoides]